MLVRSSALLFIVASACIDADPIDAGGGAGDSGEPGHAAYIRTRHPIVLVHGLLGFDDLFGVVTYFHGIPAALTADGAEVHVVTASQAASPEVRGAQLLPQIEAIAARTGRVNLIGHSLGSLDARYLAAVRPDLVASVTSVGGPHHGSPVADFLVSPAFGDADDHLLGAAADLIGLIAGSSYPNDVDAALAALTTAGAAAFNARYPAGVTVGCGEGAPVVNGIRYYSWSGVGGITNPIDPSDLMLAALGTLIREPNDGLVGRCSSHLGDVIRDDYPHNHLDETNMILGLVGLFGPRPITLYRKHVARLRDAGL